MAAIDTTLLTPQIRAIANRAATSMGAMGLDTALHRAAVAPRTGGAVASGACDQNGISSSMSWLKLSRGPSAT